MSGPFGSVILEVAIGLVLVYLLASLAVTVANELIAQLLGLRARKLQQGLRRLLDGTTSGDGNSLAAKMLAHPLIAGFSSTTGQYKPSYIPSRQFSLALLDLVAPGLDPTAPDYWTQLRQAVNSIQNEHVKVALRSLLDNSQQDVAAVRAAIEQWFDDAMDRVSGWYKRDVQKIVLVLGFVLAVLLNLDTLALAHALWTQPATRASVVAAAQQVMDDVPETFPTEPNRRVELLRAAVAETQDVGLPIGWQRPPEPLEWPATVAGLALTTLALSLGAPFWFDVLQQIVRLRGSGPPPEPETEP